LTLNSYFDNFGDVWQNELAGVIGVLGLVVIVAAGRVGFRSYRLAICLSTLAAACLSVPLVSYWMVGGTRDRQGISRFHLGRDSAVVKNLIGEIESNQAFLNRGMAAYKKATHTYEFKTPSGDAVFFPLAAGFGPNELSSLQAKLLPQDLRDAKLAARELGAERFQQAVLGTTLDKGGDYVIPRKYGAFAMVHGSLTVFETMASFEDAKKAWAENGPSIAADLTREHADMVGLLRGADQARAGRLFFYNPELYMEPVFGTLFLLPFLLLLDWVGVVIAKPRRSWPKRRLA
jgi:hypothetical protein